MTNLSKTLVAAVLSLASIASAQMQPTSRPVAAAGESLKLLGDGYKFTEGPACDKDGNVYFTDQPNNRIIKWDLQGKLSVWLEPSGRSNGLCFDKDGTLIACADDKNEMWAIAPDKSHTVLFGKYNNKLLNAPNDVWIRPDGAMYFTDPFYVREYWSPDRGPSQQEMKAVYFVAPDRKTLTRVISDLKTPNGIVGTPDGKTLYVSDLEDQKTYSYTIESDGKLSAKKLFCELGSDGMTIDSEGNVYLTGDGVTVFDKEGKKIDHIAVPDQKWTANVCFGGADRQTLFITASKAVYGLRTRTHGVGSE